MHKYPMTVLGAKTLQEELDRLKFVERPRIIEAVATARALGDLKENAEYHAAREQHGFNEGRIQEIEAKLNHVQIIDVSKIPNTGKVIFGVKVTLLNIATDQEVTYMIVGEDEADIKLQKISCSSPIARGIMGKKEGDTAIVDAPSGKIEYEILSVEH